jgi:hypothetical protein
MYLLHPFLEKRKLHIKHFQAIKLYCVSSSNQLLHTMHLLSVCLVLTAYSWKVGCVAIPDVEIPLAIDDSADLILSSLDSNSNDLDLFSPSFLNPILGDSLSFSSISLFDSGNLFPNINSFSDDDGLESAFTLTDTTLPNTCVVEQSFGYEQPPLADEQSLANDEHEQFLIARNGDYCQPANSLSPEPLQLFEDPLNLMLNRLDPTGGENPSLDFEGTYPGRLTPEEEQKRARTPGPHHNLDPVDGQEWRLYQDPSRMRNENYNDCHSWHLSYPHPLCCLGPTVMGPRSEHNLGATWTIREYPSVGNCDPKLGMNTR